MYLRTLYAVCDRAKICDKPIADALPQTISAELVPSRVVSAVRGPPMIACLKIMATVCPGTRAKRYAVAINAGNTFKNEIKRDIPILRSPEGIRTLVADLRSQSPRPLDDGALVHFYCL